MSKNTGLLFSPNPSTSKKTSSNIKGVNRSLADSDYTRKHTYDEHMLLLLSQREDIIDIFRVINEYGTKIINGELKETEHSYSEDCKRYVENRKKLGILMKKLEDAGIELASKPGSRSSYEADRIDKYDLDIPETASTKVGRSKYEYRTVIYKTTFNGLAITKDMIDTDGADLRSQSRRWDAINGDVDSRIENNRRQLNSAKWRLFIPRLLGSHDASDEIERYENEEESLNETKKEGREIKDKLDKFDSFSPTQKELIGEYLTLVDSLVVTGNDLSNRAKKYDELSMLKLSKQTMLNYSYIWQRAIAEAKQDGRITDEDLKACHDFFAKEINLSHKSTYQGGMSFYSSNIPEGVNANSFRWFMVKSVFEELKTQKQNELDTQGLIRKTEELIGAENFLIKGPVKKGDIVRKIEGIDFDEEK